MTLSIPLPPAETRYFAVSDGSTPPLARTVPPSHTVMPPRRSADLSTTAPSAQRSESDQAFFSLIQQIRNIIKRDEVGGMRDVEPTTSHAVWQAIPLLEAAREQYLLMEGDAYGDGDGGLNMDWERGNKKIVVFVHATDPRENYLYWDCGDQYGIETPLLSEVLTRRLVWLRNSAG